MSNPTTEPITLEEVALGSFEIRLYWGRVGQRSRPCLDAGDPVAFQVLLRAGHRFRIDVGGEMNFLHMDFEDFDAPLLVGTVDQHLAVEAAGAQQRGVEDLRPVGGGQEHHAALRIEAVQFGQQLV